MLLVMIMTMIMMMAMIVMMTERIKMMVIMKNDDVDDVDER